MNTRRHLPAAVALGVLATIVACAQPPVQEKAAPAAAEPSAYATAVNGG